MITAAIPAATILQILFKRIEKPPCFRCVVEYNAPCPWLASPLAFPCGVRGATIVASGLRLPARILPHGDEHHETSFGLYEPARRRRPNRPTGPAKQPPGPRIRNYPPFIQ